MNEKRYAVYLEEQDWRAIIACMLWHTKERIDTGNPLWVIGRNRVLHLTSEISSKLPKAPT